MKSKSTARSEMNSTDNTTYRAYQDSSNMDIAYGSYCCIASFLGVISNLLIIFTIGFGKHVGKQVKIQLIHLAVVDLLWSVFHLTLKWTTAFNLSLLTTTTGCKVYMFIAHSCLLASPITSATISIERVFIIYFPFKATLYRDKHKYMVIAIIWLCAGLSRFPITFKQDIHVSVVGGVTLCVFNSSAHYDPWMDMISYFLLTLIVFISYALIFIKLCTRKRSHIVCQSTGQRRRNTDKMLRMLFVDASVTILTWMPAGIVELIPALISNFDYNESYYYADEALHYLLITNAFSSFIIYFIFNNNFRMDLHLLFQGIHHKLTFTAAAIADNSATNINPNIL